MRILLIADLHIGSIKDTNYTMEVLADIFEKELKENKTDAVIFLGDYFHKSFRVNEDHTKLAINIMSYLVLLCKQNDTKIRFIYGTESHDANQYHLFNHYLKSNDVDIKIIHTVTDEELFPNMNVLYIPEEYVINKDTYYKIYFNKHYNFIFGHGVIIEGMPMVNFSKTAHNEKKVPHFKSGELSKISDICIFGHYHQFTSLEDEVYYLGSLFRDSFGEEEPKGYGIIENNKFEFIENKKAYIYKTYTFEEDSVIFKNSDNIIKEVNKIKKENKNIFNEKDKGKIRIIIKLPKDIDSVFKENLRSILFNEKFIVPLIKDNSYDLINEIQETINTEYEFILDNSLPVIDKIHRYINKNYDINLSINDIKKYINEEFKFK